mmetsp:Transcript_36952/g.103770  ORF Transcript_36952/g.103770 Transcript_36952/m.103770 type:complete len:294 (+) Transcript_36952:860-1741(+)
MRRAVHALVGGPPRAGPDDLQKLRHFAPPTLCGAVAWQHSLKPLGNAARRVLHSRLQQLRSHVQLAVQDPLGARGAGREPRELLHQRDRHRGAVAAIGLHRAPDPRNDHGADGSRRDFDADFDTAELAARHVALALPEVHRAVGLGHKCLRNPLVRPEPGRPDGQAARLSGLVEKHRGQPSPAVILEREAGGDPRLCALQHLHAGAQEARELGEDIELGVRQRDRPRAVRAKLGLHEAPRAPVLHQLPVAPRRGPHVVQVLQDGPRGLQAALAPAPELRHPQWEPVPGHEAAE